MVGIEHDSAALRLGVEHAGHEVRQQELRDPLVHEIEIRDGRVDAQIVGVAFVSGGDGIPCRPVQFDITVVLPVQAADEMRTARARLAWAAAARYGPRR